MLTRRTAAGLVLLSLSMLTLPGAAEARPRRGWELLGERTVTDRAERDVLPVTAARGAFRRIRIEVRDRAVQFHDLKIHFADGDTQDVAIREVIKAGGQSRAIDLAGRSRIIRSIELRYDAQSLFGHPARVVVLGQH